MNRCKFLIYLTSALFLVVLLGGNAYSKGPQEDMKALKINCTECHTCENPTMENECLKACPSLTWAQSSSKHQVSEAPDSMLLDKLVDQYRAVHFNHKVHAQMSDMYNGCQTCHHYSPPGHVQPCSECHGGETNPANLGQPSLKGAYHRQCLCCHREWSHDTNCTICHLPKDGQAMSMNSKDSTDIMGISHPIMTVPVKKIYYTPYKDGPVVTFYHQQHIDLFGLKCVNCHQKENCGYCHDLNRPANMAKTQEQVHAVCSNNCHKDDDCVKCHGQQEKPAFAHSRTGWRLNKYHADLSCRACHPTGKMMSKLNTNCNSCHSGWNRENFEHAITNLQLDDVHVEIDCSDCHKDRRFDAKPDCSTCHDDGRTPSSQPPGKFIKLSQR